MWSSCADHTQLIYVVPESRFKGKFFLFKFVEKNNIMLENIIKIKNNMHNNKFLIERIFIVMFYAVNNASK